MTHPKTNDPEHDLFVIEQNKRIMKSMDGLRDIVEKAPGPQLQEAVLLIEDAKTAAEFRVLHRGNPGKTAAAKKKTPPAILLSFLLAASPTLAAGAEQCVYDRSVQTSYNATIDEITDYRSSVVRHVEDTRKCTVSFDAVVGGKTYGVVDSYVFGPDMSANDACYQAELKAKHALIRHVASENITADVNLNCVASNGVENKPDGFFKKMGKIGFRMFELSMCGQPNCF